MSFWFFSMEMGRLQLNLQYCTLTSTILVLLFINLTQAQDLLYSKVRSFAMSRSKFKAAVYAHAVRAPSDTSPPSREKALQNMEVNLVIYRQQAVEAHTQGVDIIVFPEDGIYGGTFSRDTIYPYLEQIPDPNTETWNPCDDPNRHADSEVQVTLSCMAKQNQLYLVANMGDKQPCDPDLDSKCPEDRRYQYNTDVAYGPDGSFLAKYHKYNLFFEGQFDKPEPSTVYFDTPFGRVGLMTCFDALFNQPGIPLVEKYNATIIAFPTAWMDGLPLLPAIGFHSSFARKHGVNFLSANLHLPELRFDGSGLYAPDGARAVYYGVKPQGLLPKLLVAELSVMEQHKPSVSGENLAGVPEHSRDFPARARENIRLINANSTAADLRASAQYKSEFDSILNSDKYTFQTLAQPSGKLRVCQGQVCCKLDYESRLLNESELFAFGAFDGLHTHHGKYYMQNCVLVKCADAKNKTSCGKFTFASSTIFSKIALSGNFQTPYVYPQIVLSDSHGQLGISKPGAWTFDGSSLQTSDSFNGTVLNVILLGRNYQRDQEK